MVIILLRGDFISLPKAGLVDKINAIQNQNRKLKTKSKPKDNELKNMEWRNFWKLTILDNVRLQKD